MNLRQTNHKEKIMVTQSDFDKTVDELDAQGKIAKAPAKYCLLVDRKVVMWDDDLKKIVDEAEKRCGEDVASVGIQNHEDGAAFIKRAFRLADEVINDNLDDDTPTKPNPKIKAGGQYTLLVNHKIVMKDNDYNAIHDACINEVNKNGVAGSITIVNRKKAYGV